MDCKAGRTNDELLHPLFPRDSLTGEVYTLVVELIRAKRTQLCDCDGIASHGDRVHDSWTLSDCMRHSVQRKFAKRKRGVRD